MTDLLIMCIAVYSVLHYSTAGGTVQLRMLPRSDWVVVPAREVRCGSGASGRGAVRPAGDAPMRVQAAGRLGQAFRIPVVLLLFLFRQNHPKEFTSESHQGIHQ